MKLQIEWSKIPKVFWQWMKVMELVKKDLVNKSVKFLQSKNFVEEAYLNPPKGEILKNWKKIKIQNVM